MITILSLLFIGLIGLLVVSVLGLVLLAGTAVSVPLIIFGIMDALVIIGIINKIRGIVKATSKKK